MHRLELSAFSEGGKDSAVRWKSAEASVGRVVECEVLSWGTGKRPAVDLFCFKPVFLECDCEAQLRLFFRIATDSPRLKRVPICRQ